MHSMKLMQMDFKSISLYYTKTKIIWNEKIPDYIHSYKNVVSFYKTRWHTSKFHTFITEAREFIHKGDETFCKFSSLISSFQESFRGPSFVCCQNKYFIVVLQKFLALKWNLKYITYNSEEYHWIKRKWVFFLYMVVQIYLIASEEMYIYMYVKPVFHYISFQKPI